jgi:hypothetical protein
MLRAMLESSCINRCLDDLRFAAWEGPAVSTVAKTIKTNMRDTGFVNFGT